MKSRNILIIVFVILFSCNNQQESIKIGVVIPMTGDAGSYGEKGERALTLLANSINNNGGINGKQIKLIIEDSKADPKTGVSAAQKLVSIDKVQAIVGDIVSSVTLPISPICEKNEVVLIAPTSSAPDITNAGEYIYRVWPSDLAEGAAAGNFSKENGYKNAVIFHINNDYGKSISEIFIQNYQTDSTAVLLNEQYEKDQSDFKSLIIKAKSKSPDVTYIPGYYADVAKILRQSKELGFENQFIGVTAIEDDEFLKIAGSASEGVIYPLASGFDINSNDKIVKEFIKNFKDHYGYNPGWVEAHCYDALLVIIEALKNTENKTGSELKKYIDSKKEFNGVTGKIIFDSNGDVIKPVVYKKVENNKFVRLK